MIIRPLTIMASRPTPPGPGPLPPIPSNTVRVRTNNGQPPVKFIVATYETATLVDGTSDVYDVYKSGTNFDSLLYNSTNIVEVLGGNTTGITDMQYMLYGCSSLTTVSLFDTSSVMFTNHMFMECISLLTIPLFDTSNVSNMYGMFASCSSLTSIPLFNTSKVTDISHAFNNCLNVQSGALALYQQASSQTNPPSNHSHTFYRCGENTLTGSAELAQIPSDWKE